MIFRFGNRKVRATDLIGADQVARLKKKFAEVPSGEFDVSLRELLRFLYLCAYGPTKVFFPGNKLIDDLWHALITETESYRSLCHRIKPGSFLDHSGIPYAEYIADMPAEKVHEEQMSWLASYYHNFGPIEPEAFRVLYLAEALAERFGGDLAGLNAVAAELVDKSLVQGVRDFDFDDYLFRLRSSGNTVDRDPEILNGFLRELVSECSKENSPLNPLQNQHMEMLFGASTALAFTLWQHLAACERLSEHAEWQSRNPEMWDELKRGNILCGLATTHLAKPSGPSIRAEFKDQQFLISGHADWVCGWGLFDYLLVGFELGDEIVFAVTEFPGREAATADKALVVPHLMACLGGSATVAIDFREYPVQERGLVSRRATSNAPAPRPSRFLVPEIGIAKYVISKIEKQGKSTDHPRKKMVAANLDKLKERIKTLEDKKGSSPLDELMYLRDEINRDAVRILAVYEGARSVQSDSEVPRLQLELLLLDSVAQPPSSFERKIKSSVNGRHV